MKTQLKSMIDWNEIVPLLRKDLQETLMLEAVMILSAPRRRPAAEAPRKPAVNGFRYWREKGDGGTLADGSRVYLINREAKLQLRTDSMAGKVWKNVREMKGETISYAGMATLCKAMGQTGRQGYFIGYLWGRGLIDIKKVAIAS